LIENASHITGIAIERHMNEQALQRERDRLRFAPASSSKKLL
jgi:formate hydrogenlyase transcriptional activator